MKPASGKPDADFILTTCGNGEDNLKLNRVIGSKAFYRKLFAIMLPILVQNVITNFVSLLDNIMVGQVGTEPMSGVAIVNQLIFVFNLCIFGGLAGAGIFTAQYYGKNDSKGVADTFRAKLEAAYPDAAFLSETPIE